ncbi:MAG: aldehyde dehydrogenase family protein [Ignavibacteria bacterium]|nr:aldehyde dehydrogenase family protein [Ignavibacteria bacterium]
MRLSKFKNEPFTDFSKKKNKQAFEKALEKVTARFKKEYPITIGGEKFFTDNKLYSYNPSNKEETVGVFQRGTAEMGIKAIEIANNVFGEWKNVPVKTRVKYLVQAAKIMRKRKHEFSAMMVYEVGKNWAEADGDTAEAIDFMEFYAREMLRYEKGQDVVKIPGFELLEEIKLPKGVVNFVTGDGSVIGDLLITHPLTRFISFTGSMEVGLRINELAAKKQPSQIWIKRVVAEMGGKDSIVVDADLINFDETVKGVVQAAFGFQGQKCSACSRVIVDQKIYDKFCDALVEETKKIKVGDAKDNPGMGPVVNEKSKNSITNYIKTAIDEGGKLIHGGMELSEKGYFIQPTIIKDVDKKATIAQEEIFGPVLAVIKSKNFDDGLEIANNTIFGLTGAVYTKHKKKLEKAEKEFFVGNLYLNRKCTGALVGVHPFGGFNMSGTDSKAGGPDYLGLFQQAKSIAQKVK